MSNYTEKLGTLLDGITSKVSNAVQKSSSSVSNGKFEKTVKMPKRENYASEDSYRSAFLRAKAGKTKTDNETSSVVMPNRKNYDDEDEYRSDFLRARAGTKVFKNGAYNYGVTSEYITELDNTLNDFMKQQSDTLSKASFGDFSGEQEASKGIQKILDSLQAVKNYRTESEFYLAKPTDKAKLSSALYDTSADSILKRASDVANNVSTAATYPKKQTAEDFSKTYKENRLKEATRETERDEDLVALDNTISYVEERLKAVEDAWANKHELYDTFKGDEEMYDTAVYDSKYGKLTYDELEAMGRAAEEIANTEAISMTETDAGIIENASGITAEDLAQWEEQEATERKRRADEQRARREAREREIREKNDYALQEYLATHDDEVRRAAVTFDSMSPKTQAYVNRTLAGFRQSVSRAFGIPRTRAVNASLAEISDVLVADYLQNGMISDATRRESFDRLFERVQRVNNDFYEEYAPLMRDLKNTHLVISREDSGDLPEGYSNFRTVASSRLSTARPERRSSSTP